MSNKFGQHEHGEAFTIDLNNPRQRECFKQLSDTYAVAGEYLVLLGISLLQTKKATLPCKKCLFDVALQFRDIGALLEELAGFNPNKD